MNAKKIVLWGIGDRVKRYMKFKYFMNCEIVVFVDFVRK